MNTKATIVLGALLSAGTLLAQTPDQNQVSAVNTPETAQTQTARQHRNFDPAKQAEHLGKRLGLNSDQVAQITPILADRQQQMKSLHADASLSQQDRREKAKDIMQDSKTKLEAVMTDSQKQQFEQMLAQRRNHHNRQPQS